MRRLLLAAIASLALFAPRAAHAQSKEDVARADALFNAAKALTDAGQYTDACAKFAESKRLAPGLGVTLYLADCYEHIGRTASAWTEFRAAEGLARERNDKRADVARARAQALEPKLERLTIVVAPTVPQAGLEVLRDGSPVAREELGLPVPVDPGDHAVVVSAPGHPPRTLTAHTGPESPSATVTIDRLEEAPGAGVPPVPVPTATTTATGLPELPPAPPPEDKNATRRWIGVGVGGLGVVGVAVGSVFGVVAKQKFDQSNSVQCNASTDQCYAPGFPMRKDAEHAATASDVSFAIGGVLLATGIVLFVTAPKPHSPPTGVVVAPAPVAGGGGGALLRATF
jgi:serine/threonine-protein kinase